MINSFNTSNLNFNFNSYTVTAIANMRLHEQTVENWWRTVREMTESQIRDALREVDSLQVLHDLARRLDETGHEDQAKVVWSMWDEKCSY